MNSLDAAGGLTISGLNVGDSVGTAVSSAGDFNGDDIDDFIVGAPDIDYVNEDQNGAAYLIYGTNTGFPANIDFDLTSIDGTFGFAIVGHDDGRLGETVAAAGDINGDGFDDVLLAMPRGYVATNGSTRSVSVLYGTDQPMPNILPVTSSLLQPVQITTPFEDPLHDHVRGAGDVNGDGFADIIVGHRGTTNNHSDVKTNVLFGSSSGVVGDIDDLNGSNGFTIAGMGWTSSYAFDGAGDINNDGFDDVIVGSAEGAYVIFGAASGFPARLEADTLDGTNGFKIGSAGFNNSAAGLGDVNGDGIDDIAIGLPTGESDYEYATGKTFVIFGSSNPFPAVFDETTLDGWNGFVVEGKEGVSVSGLSVDTAGDFNADGINDLLIGAPHVDSADESLAGESYVVFGRNSSWPASLRLAELDPEEGFAINGTPGYARAGTVVSAAGDVNADGADDLIIGAAGLQSYDAETSKGKAYVVFGSATRSFDGANSGSSLSNYRLDLPAGFVSTYTVSATVSQFASGSLDVTATVSPIGQTDSNPTNDTALRSTPVQPREVDIEVQFDQNVQDLNAGGPFSRIVTVTNNGKLHSHVNDVLIEFGAKVDDLTWTKETTSTDPTTSYDWPTVDQQDGFTFTGGADERVGSDVVGLGDVNGDEIDDVAVITLLSDTGGNRAEVSVIFGTSGSQPNLERSQLDGTNGFHILGGYLANSFGNVAHVGDVNGDGLNDIAIVDGLSGIGTVIFGAPTFPALLDPSTLSGTDGFQLTSSDRLSNPAGLGDVNNDGFVDLGFTEYGTSKTYVLFGGDDPFAASIDLNTLDGTDGFEILGTGFFVDGLEDFNGDGFADIVLQPGTADVYLLHGVAQFPATVDLQNPGNLDLLKIQGFDFYAPGMGNVTEAGDLNGDGLTDLAIGIYRGGYTAGRTHVIFGTSNSLGPVLNVAELDGGNGFQILGDGRLNQSGTRISTAGDFNGDGLDDLLISSRLPGAGAAYVVYGAAEGFPGRIDLSEPNLAGRGTVFRLSDGSLRALNSAGDFNDDGLDDIIVGIPFPNQGLAHVIYGRRQSVVENGTGRVSEDLELAPGDVVTYTFSGTVSPGVFSDGVTSNASVSVLSAAVDTDLSNNTLSLTEGATPAVELGLFLRTYGDVVPLEPTTFDLSVGNEGAVTATDATVAFAVDHVVDDATWTRRTYQDLSQIGGSNGKSYFGKNSNDRAGISSTFIGDINADGFDDFAYGVDGIDVPNETINSGAVYVLFGSANRLLPNVGELDGTNGFRIDGVTSWAYLGHTISPAGDVNGDGIDDFVVGGQFQSAERRSFVVFGTDQGFAPELDLLSLAPSQGFALVADLVNVVFDAKPAGDINNDGFDDLLIAAPGLNSEGNAYAVLGQSSFSGDIDLLSLNGADGFLITGALAGQNLFGSVVAGIGDVDGDGFDDFAIAGPHEQFGEIHVLLGKGTFGASVNVRLLSANDGFLIEGKNLTDYLSTVAAAGDVNGDGIDDFMLGAPGVTRDLRPDSGEVYFIYGSASGFGNEFDLRSLDGTNGLTVRGFQANDVGDQIRSLGDINADGLGDYLIDGLYILFGEDFGGRSIIDVAQPDIALMNLAGLGHSSLRSRLGVGGDFDNDGINDLAIGDHQVRNPVIPGSNSGVAHLVFGNLLLGPTVNGSGNIDETITLLPGIYQTYSVSGTAKSNLPSTVTLDPTVTLFPSDPIPENNTLTATLNVAQRDADVFAQWIDPNPPFSPGLAFEQQLRLGNNGTFDANGVTVNAFFDSQLENISWTREIHLQAPELANLSPNDGEYISGSGQVRVAGDVNNDGFSDAIVGNQVIYGSADGIDVSEIGFANDQSLGFSFHSDTFTVHSVNPVGDVNDDGHDDLAIVAIPADSPTTALGKVYVYFGSASVVAPQIDLETTAGLILDSIGPGDLIDAEITGDSDLNGDGIDDIVVGARGAGTTGSGDVYVVFGTASSPGSIWLGALDGGNGFVLRDSAGGAAFGAQVSVGGDINADGIDDLLVSGNGNTYALFGSGSHPSTIDVSDLGSLGFAILPGSTGSVGSDVAILGDVNADGADEFLIGVVDGTTSGTAYLFFGSPELDDDFNIDSFESSHGVTLRGGQTLREVGRTVGFAGDVNGDGIGDLMVSAYTTPNRAEGDTFVIYGTDQLPESIDLSQLPSDIGFEFKGLNIRTDFGLFIDGDGDFNGDGLSDIIVGAPRIHFDDYRGQSYLIYGQAGPEPISGTGPINETLDLPAGAVVTYTISGNVKPAANSAISNYVFLTVGAGHTDPDPTNNTDTTSKSLAFAPEVESITINQGHANRSSVQEIAVTFDAVVDHSGLENAFVVTNHNTLTQVGEVYVSATDVNGKTVATLNFGGDSTVGEGSIKSLTDGNYRLSILAQQVLAGGVPLDGDANGVGGGNYQFGNVAEDEFFRLFGDMEGDRDVDFAEFGPFGLAYRRRVGEAGFDATFDNDLDGDVDLFDYAEFGLRFRGDLPFV